MVCFIGLIIIVSEGVRNSFIFELKFLDLIGEVLVDYVKFGDFISYVLVSGFCDGV